MSMPLPLPGEPTHAERRQRLRRRMLVVAVLLPASLATGVIVRPALRAASMRGTMRERPASPAAAPLPGTVDAAAPVEPRAGAPEPAGPPPQVVAMASTPRGTTSRPRPVSTRSPAVPVPLDAFRVSEVVVAEDGARATIRGFLTLEKRGVTAQPLLRYELLDRDGTTVRTGTFTPMDANGPLWVGYGFQGLRRSAFANTIDLRGNLPGRLPPRPYSARVRVVRVIDARAER